MPGVGSHPQSHSSAIEGATSTRCGVGMVVSIVSRVAKSVGWRACDGAVASQYLVPLYFVRRRSTSEMMNPKAGHPPDFTERSNQVRAFAVSPLTRYQLPTP